VRYLGNFFQTSDTTALEALGREFPDIPARVIDSMWAAYRRRLPSAADAAAATRTGSGTPARCELCGQDWGLVLSVPPSSARNLWH
jgi:hypothetical protein